MSDNRITYGLAKKYGDIVAVRKKEGDPITGPDMLSFAVKNVGKKLDTFSKLWRFYSKNGFEPVSWTTFDEKEAPKDWKKGRDEEGTCNILEIHRKKAEV